jgi:glutamine synthetase
VPVESSKGEAWPGQQEINFRYGPAVETADNHVVFKTGTKEIAHQHGCSVTFMAKPDHTMIGSSCHVHMSLWRDGVNAFAGRPAVFEQFLAGWIAHAPELALFLAPSINSYKRFVSNSWAPTSLAWGNDNRSCGFRVVGHGSSQRVETRIPGGDVNPYLASAALIAAGLDGIEQGLELRPAHVGSAYEAQVEQFPTSLRQAVAELERSEFARRAFGEQVVDHYLNYGRTEQRLFDEVVTCYERERMFERG